jgi:acetoacetyl-CoA synthetase
MPKDEPIPQMRLYREWLERERGLTFADYGSLWRWSTTDLAGFWRSIWDYYRLESPTPIASVIDNLAMPGATWFAGAQVNYARQVFRHVDAAEAAHLPAIVAENEQGVVTELSWKELSPHIFPTFRKRRLQCSLAPAWARSGRCAHRTWARVPC